MTIPNKFPSEKGDFRIIKEKYVPEIDSELRKKPIHVPEKVYDASGIRIQGTRLKSFLFSTDISIIKNSNAQAVFAVYPFTPQLIISQAIIQASSVPVFVGVGGGTTTGKRSVNLAVQSEFLGAFGVVVNAPMKNEVIAKMYKVLDIPIIATVVSEYDDIAGKINAGARILNVSGGKKTPDLIRQVVEIAGPGFPIIGTGGPTSETIEATIDAGAHAITYTPPSSAELFADMMEEYRKRSEEQGRDHDREVDIEEVNKDLVFKRESIEYLKQKVEEQDHE